MKRKIHLLGLLFFISLVSANAQSSYFYYHKGEKQYLELDTKHIFVSVSDTTQRFSFDGMIQQSFQVDVTQKVELKDYKRRFWSKLSIEEDLSEKVYLAKLSEIKNTGNDIIVAPYFKERIGLSNFFYVKLKSLSDTTLLIQEANKEKATIVFQVPFMPLWFVVSITESSRFNAVEAANYFFESGMFQNAEPDLMVEVQTTCANDTYFSNQWGLKNTGQYGGTVGVDIKACEAWRISTGSNIVVAVNDRGIELDHRDLKKKFVSIKL